MVKALIAERFPERQEEARQVIRESYEDEIDVLPEDPTTYASWRQFQAIIGFYKRIAREIQAGELELPEPASLYNLAQELVEGKDQWTSGETCEIWRNGKCEVYVREYGYDGGGLLEMVFRNGGPWQTASIKCGYLSLRQGWLFTLEPAAYGRWVEKATRLA